ncbi:MAG: MBL fold metallo-hydrolase [Clostridiales bacterium]|nr:MBL fold metallo-hydrolase [Clostridiales bacterium]
MHQFYPYLTNKISENLYVFIERNEPLYESWGRTLYVNSMQLVIGTERAALIDTGYGYGDLLALARKFTDLPLILLITHDSFDHWRGANQFSRTCEIYMNEFDQLAIADMKKSANIQFDAKPLNDGDVFDLGGIQLESIIVPGHTKGSICFLDRKNNHLFSGDAVNRLPWIFSGKSNVQQYCDALKRLRDMTPEQPDIFCGHAHESFPYQVLHDTIQACEDVLAGAGDDPQYRSPFEENGAFFPNVYMHETGLVRLCYSKDFIR